MVNFGRLQTGQHSRERCAPSMPRKPARRLQLGRWQPPAQPLAREVDRQTHRSAGARELIGLLAVDEDTIAGLDAAVPPILLQLELTGSQLQQVDRGGGAARNA